MTSLFSWKFWIVVLIVVFGIVYLLFGGHREYEIVGLKPLANLRQIEIPPNRPEEPRREPEYRKEPQHRKEPEPIQEEPKRCKYRSIGEQLTCQAFETLLGYKVMTNYRPDCLKNPITRANLELDCYDPKTQIAIEYNGQQHYVWPNRFHTREQFDDQIYRDQLKVELCNRNRIYLIRVPYLVDTMCQTPNGPKNRRYQQEERYQRIYDFLQHHLIAYNEHRVPGPHYTTEYIPGM